MIIEHDFKMKFDDDMFISIFNVDTKEIIKALKCFEIIYGKKKLKALDKSIKNGLMALFSCVPTDEIIMFALIITQIQNKRKK